MVERQRTREYMVRGNWTKGLKDTGNEAETEAHNVLDNRSWAIRCEHQLRLNFGERGILDKST